MNYLRQLAVSSLPNIDSYLPPASRSDGYLQVGKWSLTHEEDNNSLIQSIVVNGVLTTALWSGGTVLTQEILKEKLNWLLDSRLETVEMKSSNFIKMSSLGNACLNALLVKNAGPLFGLSTGTVKRMGQKLDGHLVMGYAARLLAQGLVDLGQLVFTIQQTRQAKKFKAKQSRAVGVVPIQRADMDQKLGIGTINNPTTVRVGGASPHLHARIKSAILHSTLEITELGKLIPSLELGGLSGVQSAVSGGISHMEETLQLLQEVATFAKGTHEDHPLKLGPLPKPARLTPRDDGTLTRIKTQREKLEQTFLAKGTLR